MCLPAHGITEEEKIIPSANQGLNWKASEEFSRPKTLVCYICGREFGTTSLEIHLKACKIKWETTEEKKLEEERRPLPQPPAEF